MILTNCAACAAPLAHDAPRCVRCWTRYCDSTCQHDHWRRGHKQMCKKIHRGGNAEQYYVDKKYKEAVAEAVEACAEDIWHFHFYGYADSREDLRMALELLEGLVDDSVRVRGADHEITKDLCGILRHARNVQLDWCVDDLTPATFYECGPGLLLESSTDSEGEADAADAAEVLAIL